MSYSDSVRHAPPQGMMNSKQLAELIGRTPKSIEIDSRMRPDCLPPITRIAKGPNFWRISDVQAWLQCMGEVVIERGMGASRCIAYDQLGFAATAKLQGLRVEPKASPTKPVRCKSSP